jgi:hypothetical protein
MQLISVLHLSGHMLVSSELGFEMMMKNRNNLAIILKELKCYCTNIAGPPQTCQIIIILKKNAFGKTNFNLQYFN